jgi:hypothetical protein
LGQERKEEAAKQRHYESDPGFWPNGLGYFPAKRGAMLRAPPDASACTHSYWKFQGSESIGFLVSAQVANFSSVVTLFHVFHPISQPQEFDFSPVTTKARFN